MADTTERLILELQAKISKYNADILDAAKKTEAFQFAVDTGTDFAVDTAGNKALGRV